MQIKLQDWHSKNFDNTMWMKVRETDAQTYCWWELYCLTPCGEELDNIYLSLRRVFWQAP